jgi:hypothetical protein
MAPRLLARVDGRGESSAPFSAWREAVEARLSALTPEADGTRRPARRLRRYALLAPGKRLRPLLTMAASAQFGGDPLGALDPACAFEMVHAASLVLDDLPCMDDAALRRGRPAAHLAFGPGRGHPRRHRPAEPRLRRDRRQHVHGARIAQRPGRAAGRRGRFRRPDRRADPRPARAGAGDSVRRPGAVEPPEDGRAVRPGGERARCAERDASAAEAASTSAPARRAFQSRRPARPRRGARRGKDVGRTATSHFRHLLAATARGGARREIAARAAARPHGPGPGRSRLRGLPDAGSRPETPRSATRLYSPMARSLQRPIVVASFVADGGARLGRCTDTFMHGGAGAWHAPTTSRAPAGFETNDLYAVVFSALALGLLWFSSQDGYHPLYFVAWGRASTARPTSSLQDVMVHGRLPAALDAQARATSSGSCRRTAAPRHPRGARARSPTLPLRSAGARAEGAAASARPAGPARPPS